MRRRAGLAPSPDRRPAIGPRLRRWARVASLVVVCLPSLTFAALQPAAAADTTGGSAPSAPGLRREGDRIVVPAGSPYRSHLVVEPVERRAVERTLAMPAQVEANPAHVYNVLPPLSGRVTALDVGLGQHVAKDQPLVSIESGDLAQALADVAKATAQVALTHRALDRARNLNKAGGGAVKDVESATNDAAQADDELTRAQSRLATIAGGSAQGGAGNGSPRTLTVQSPADGVVTALATAAGAYINDPTQSLMTITDLATVWVTAAVPEDDIAFVFKDQPADIVIDAYPRQVLHGKVAFVGDITEPDTRRTKVRIAVADPDGRYKPNMFATVTFRAPSKVSLLVPDGALLMNNDSTSVFVETAPWTFVRREVGVGYDADGRTVITGGLTAGERIVTQGGVLLND